MTGASSRVATFAIASAFAEAMAVKSAAEERIDYVEIQGRGRFAAVLSEKLAQGASK